MGGSKWVAYFETALSNVFCIKTVRNLSLWYKFSSLAIRPPRRFSNTPIWSSKSFMLIRFYQVPVLLTLPTKKNNLTWFVNKSVSLLNQFLTRSFLETNLAFWGTQPSRGLQWFAQKGWRSYMWLVGDSSIHSLRLQIQKISKVAWSTLCTASHNITLDICRIVCTWSTRSPDN